jgi:gluconate 5-dehydrogenase
MSLQKFRLDGRIALITGSSGGIGLALARGLAAAGARVAINGRSADKVGAVVAQLSGEGLSVCPAVFDVADREAVTRGVAAIEAGHGPIDILINNAGIQRRGAFEDYPDNLWEEITATNLDAVFFVTRAVGKSMVGRKRGSVINICSVMSEIGRPTVVPYAATKGAVKMMTKGLAAEWGKHGIRVNGIGPGYFATEMNTTLVNDATFSAWVAGRTPLGRWGDVDELVGAAIFLASDAASFVTGHVLMVDGGMTSVV